MDARIKDELPGGGYKLIASDDGEKLRFYYPTLLGKHPDYLTDHVLLEFGTRNCTEPSDRHLITSLLAEVVEPTLILPTAELDVLSPLRTFWEKATLIHVECHRGRLNESPDRLSRHWYDLAILARSWVGEKAMNQKDILESVVKYKSALFNASYAHYEYCLTNRFRLIPSESKKENLLMDYNKMRDSGLFQEEPPLFKDLLLELTLLEKKLNTMGEV